jgi:hypothetical protein
MKAIIRRSARWWALAAAVVVVGLVVVGTAAASVQTITVNPKATLLFNGDVAVTGSIRCTAGDTFSVGVTLSQIHARTSTGGAGGVEGFACTGLTQPWVAEVVPFEGQFARSTASAFVGAQTGDGSSAFLATTVHIQK